MKYSIKQASILLKQKTHAIYDDDGDKKTLIAVLKEAVPNNDYAIVEFFHNRYFYLSEKTSKIDFGDFDVCSDLGLETILLSDIVNEIEPETFTISKEDYDKFKALESGERRLSRDEFAAASISGLISQVNGLSTNSIIKECYRIADEFIKQRDL